MLTDPGSFSDESDELFGRSLSDSVSKSVSTSDDFDVGNEDFVLAEMKTGLCLVCSIGAPASSEKVSCSHRSALPSKSQNLSVCRYHLSC